jgi:hypothetical protein
VEDTLNNRKDSPHNDLLGYAMPKIILYELVDLFGMKKSKISADTWIDAMIK